MSFEIVKGLVDSYINETHQKEDDIYRGKLKELIYNELKRDIIDLEKDNMRTELLSEIRKEEKERNVQKLKIFLFETLFLGFIVGLGVNQATDIISHFKGGQINISATWLAIGIILGIAVLLTLMSYLNSLEKLFIKDKNK